PILSLIVFWVRRSMFLSTNCMPAERRSTATIAVPPAAAPTTSGTQPASMVQDNAMATRAVAGRDRVKGRDTLIRNLQVTWHQCHHIEREVPASGLPGYAWYVHAARKDAHPGRSASR